MLALLASAALLQAFPQEARAPATNASRAASQGGDIPVRRLSTRPQAYYGRQVTLRGVVGRVYGRQAFSFDDGTGGAGVLVLLPGEPEGSVAEGLEVIVTGTASAFVDVDAYRELGWLDATPELVATLSQLPVVVARTASLADGTTLLQSTGASASADGLAEGERPARNGRARGIVSGSTGTSTTRGVSSSEVTRGATGNGMVRGASASEVTRGATGTDVTRGPSFTAATRGTTGSDVTRGATGTDATSGPTTISFGVPETPQGLSASADRIAGSPGFYAGRRVVLTADVASVESDGLFVLEPDVAAGALLVLNPWPLSPPAAGARVTVSGTVRPYSSEELGRFDPLPPNAEAFLVRYAGRPVVLADSIRTSDGRELVAAPTPR